VTSAVGRSGGSYSGQCLPRAVLAKGSAARPRGKADDTARLASRLGKRRASRTYEPVELLEPGVAEFPAPLVLPELLPPMWVQLCLPVDPGIVPAWLVPDEDGDDDADALGEEDEDEVVEAFDVVALVPEPPVDASATPVAPAPTPAATTPVMMSRRARPPILETIRVPPFATARRVARLARLRDQRASQA